MACAFGCRPPSSLVDSIPIGPFKYLLGSKGDSGFGSFSTGAEVVAKLDLTGKVFVVTGANRGLGLELSRQLYRCGGHVLLLCRQLEDAQATAGALKKEYGGTGQASPLRCDLASLSSVHEAAATLLCLGLPLHALLHNAAVMAPSFSLTPDGIEMQSSVNVVAPQLLTSLLLGRLVETARQDPSGQARGRVVYLTCTLHYFAYRDHGKFRSQGVHINQHSGYNRWLALGTSKSGCILQARELGRRCAQASLPILAFSANPGLFSSAPACALLALAPGALTTALSFLEQTWGGWPFFKTVAQAAATPLLCCVSEDLGGHSGAYFSNCRVDTPSTNARDSRHATTLWEETESIIARHVSI
eukprot:CAMPEP_0196598678 /NCGR_PEP_ID=MMETSP1081-20130531/94451_1 /TAXON_ID=36882 /ORGANISM="Pyramimonas amylifera, Strain CCMP720" /LENGTH=358 /DNA_ID=CAMNT_0041924395 /DNA_START=116 /DNA_END=1192 /DNA_ORIENTATION=-